MIIPRSLDTSAFDLGCGNLCIASIFAGSGWIPSVVRMWPRYGSSVLPKRHLSRLSLKFSSRHLCKTNFSRSSCSSRVVPDTSMSSTYVCTPGMSEKASVTIRWKTSGAELIPNGSLRYLYRPNGVAMVVR